MLSFGIVISLWSVSAVAFTLTEALNVAYGIEETRSRRKRFAFALVFGPLLALALIVASGLMLIGPRVAGWFAGLAGLDEAWVALWAWLHYPVALFLLAAVPGSSRERDGSSPRPSATASTLSRKPFARTR